MTPATYVRRNDDELVEAIQYTGDNRAAIRQMLGAGYRVSGNDLGRLALTREHPHELVEVSAWDWASGWASGTTRCGRSRSAATAGKCRSSKPPPLLP